MKRLIVFLIVTMLWPLLAAAQGIAGVWEGTLDAGGNKLRVVFRIAENNGVCSATMDSPDQGLRGFPVASAEFRNSQLTLGMPEFKAGYKGLLNAGMIVGVFSQNGYDMPLVLTRKMQEEVVLRPQEPFPPYPYRVEEVEIPNLKAGFTIRGTLTLPEVPGRYPAVILLTGSGCQNRDEELMGHKPFLVLADYLTRQGFAVLRCDDRGWNESPEQRTMLAGSTMADFAEDALLAFGYLQSRSEVNPAQIGMLGHSEGGAVALIAAAQDSGVAFVVSLAGPMCRGRELLLVQNKAVLLQNNVPEAMADDYCRVLDKVFGVIETTPSEAIAANHAQIVDSLITPEKQLPEALRNNLVEVLKQASGPYMRYFLAYDPAGGLAALGARPLMAVNGSKDYQVDAAKNLGVVAKMRPASEHPADTIRCYEGLNHLFQPCETGGMAEYAQIETTISPQVLEDIAAWIGKAVYNRPNEMCIFSKRNVQKSFFAHRLKSV